MGQELSGVRAFTKATSTELCTASVDTLGVVSNRIVFGAVWGGGHSICSF